MLPLPDSNGTGDVLVRDVAATAVELAYRTSCLGTSPIPAPTEGIGQPFVGRRRADRRSRRDAPGPS
jgi:hypothetical protein